MFGNFYNLSLFRCIWVLYQINRTSGWLSKDTVQRESVCSALWRHLFHPEDMPRLPTQVCSWHRLMLFYCIKGKPPDWNFPNLALLNLQICYSFQTQALQNPSLTGMREKSHSLPLTWLLPNAMTFRTHWTSLSRGSCWRGTMPTTVRSVIWRFELLTSCYAFLFVAISFVRFSLITTTMQLWVHHVKVFNTDV